MTRKRFIKLMMGHGIGRNYAYKHARLARRIPGSYQRYYYEFVRPVFEAAWSKP